MYVLHSKWFSSYSKSSKFCDLLCFFALLLPFLQVTEEVKCFVLSPLIHGTDPWFLLLVMYIVFSVTECASSWYIFSCVVIIVLWVLNVLVKVKSMIISSFWSAASISLVHRNPLCEYCSLVGQGVLEGNAPSAIKWSTALGVEFWAQHPQHTQTQPVFNPSVD